MILVVNYGQDVISTDVDPTPPSGEHAIDAHPTAIEGPGSRHGPIGFFDRESFLISAAVEHLLPAFHQGAMAVAVLTAHHRDAVERALALAGVDVEVARARGQYVAADSERLAEQLVVSGDVDVDRFAAVVDDLFGAAANHPGEARICGDLATVLWEAGEVDAVLTLERLWNQPRDAPAFRLLCLYSTSAIEAATLEDFSAACGLHTEIEPVESYERLVGRDAGRAFVVLDAQQRSRRATDAALSRRGLELESALEDVMQEVEDRQAQFRQALASRDVIGQAKGIIMVRWRVDADTAFAMLRDASSRSHHKLHVTARAVVEHQLRRN